MTSSVLISLPADADAPGIREGIRERAQWELKEVVDGWGAVQPVEGAGAIFPYFKAHKLCDAKTPLRSETWEPLRRNPGWSKNDVPAPRSAPGGDPDPDWQNRLLDWGDELVKEGRRGSDLAAVSATLTALPPERVPDYLQAQAKAFFEGNPKGSLWFFEVDPLLPRRIALLRVLLALEMVPDLLGASGQAFPRIRTLQEHSLTGGIAFQALVEPLLLAIPPTALGYSFSLMPHGLVFLFGHATLITEKHPPTFASLYVPRLHGSGAGFHWRESDFFADVGEAEVETLFQWWVSRLNVIYSYALDPANFGDAAGRFQPARQTVWFMTFERLVADALSIGSSPQASALSRQETGFDLLDKAEALLGYTKKRSGKGFQRLLRRDEMIPRLDEIWDSRLPLQLRARFKVHTRHLYKRIYDHVREEAYDFRVTANGVNVWSTEEGRLVEWTWRTNPRFVESRFLAHAAADVVLMFISSYSMGVRMPRLE